MSCSFKDIIIENTDFPLLTKTIINQEIIEKNGNFIPINRLAQLKVALDALQPVPPNATTVWFDNTILLQDAIMSLASNTINNSGIVINNDIQNGYLTLDSGDNPQFNYVGLYMTDYIDPSGNYAGSKTNINPNSISVINNNGLSNTNIIDSQIVMTDGTGTYLTQIKNSFPQSYIIQSSPSQLGGTSTSFYGAQYMTLNNNGNNYRIELNTQGSAFGSPGLLITDDTDTRATYSSQSAIITTLGGPTNTLTAGDMTINDNGSINVSQITSDYAQFNTTSSSQSNLTSSYLSIDDVGNSSYTRLNANDGLRIQNDILANPPTSTTDLTYGYLTIDQSSVGGYRSSLYPSNLNIIAPTTETMTLSTDYLEFQTGTFTIKQSANGTLIFLDDNNKQINLETLNLTSYSNNYTLPICYTYKYSRGFNFSTPTTWQMVRSDTINSLPNDFYSSANLFWDYKLEISLNLNACSNPTDKAMAFYFEFRDSNGNPYNPFLFNLNTPFTRHSNGSTYNNTATDMLTFTLTDYVNLNGIGGVAPPLEWRLWWYADNPVSSNFNMLISMTRTNIV